MDTYRVKVVEMQRREITLYARSPAEAIDHAVAEGTSVLHSALDGPATVTVESVTRLTLNGPTRTTPTK